MVVVGGVDVVVVVELVLVVVVGGGGPAETTMLTELPGVTEVPAAGSEEMTTLAGKSVEG